MNMSGSASLCVSVEATGSSRMNLGLHHLLAACSAAKRIRAVEESHKDLEFGEFWEEILQDSLVVATSAVASIECYANDLFFEGAFIGDKLVEAARQKLEELVERDSIITKYSTALAFKSGKVLDKGAYPVQDVEVLIKLRNFLVHYRSEWSGMQHQHDRLSNLLKHKFQPSGFLPSDESLMPKAWAGTSFACWAITCSCAFLDHFYGLADEPSPLVKFKTRIQETSGCSIS